MFPKRSFLDVVDEAYGGKVHIILTVQFDGGGLGYVGWLGRSGDRALEGHSLVVSDRTGQLSRAKDVGHEEVIIQTPNTVTTSWFKGVSED